MLRTTLAALLLLWLPSDMRSQGILTFYNNPGAPTYLISTNGSFAGPGIWGQALVGLTADSLTGACGIDR